MNRVIVPAHQATWAGGLYSLDRFKGLLKNLKIRALFLLQTRDFPYANDMWTKHGGGGVEGGGGGGEGGVQE
jgi:hypothetical protein